MTLRTLSSFESFHRLLPALVKRLNENPELAARALVNPVLAIAELGIELTPDVAREVELRARVPLIEDRRHAAILEDKIRHHIHSETFDPDSTPQIEELLFKHLKLERPPELETLDPPRQELRTRPPVIKKPSDEQPTLKMSETKTPAVNDPLRVLRGKHPVVDLLLEYRAITLRVPKFAPRDEYERFKKYPKAVQLQQIKVNLPQHVEEGDANG